MDLPTPNDSVNLDTLPVTFDDVRAAAERIAGVAHVTPVATSRTLDGKVGAQVFAKCENLQRIGAFKFRGAYNALASLSAAQRKAGIVAYSSGNHAQAIALAAQLLHTNAVIVMPADAPQSKLDATVGYGAEVITYDRYREDRTEIGARLAGERGLTLIPSFDHPEIIAGQGTAALEFLSQVRALDALLVPISGGGLIAGSAIVAKKLRPNIRIIGIEPTAGDDTLRSLKAGHRIRIDVPRTIADAQAVDMPGELTFAINKHVVDDIVLVDDDELIDGMRFIFERMKMVAEPTGAGGIAALLARKVVLPHARIGVIISGGNIDSTRFAGLISRI